MTYRIADLTTTSAGTGTISSSGVNLTGSGTAFLSELSEGNIVHASGQTVVVATVTNNTTATVVTAPGTALAGATFTITSPSDVSTIVADAVVPLGSFNRWVSVVDLGNGVARATGRPKASWLFKNPSTALRTALQVFCPGKSARVYICTLADPSNSTFVTYQAAMLWPDNDNVYNQDFVIDFRDLVAL